MAPHVITLKDASVEPFEGDLQSAWRHPVSGAERIMRLEGPDIRLRLKSSSTLRSGLVRQFRMHRRD